MSCHCTKELSRALLGGFPNSCIKHKVPIYGTLVIVLGATLMYRKALEMSCIKITALPISFSFIYDPKI